MLPEYIGENVHYQFILGEEFGVPLGGLVANGFHDFDIQFRVARNELPEALTAKLNVIAFFLALSGLFSVTASIHAQNGQRITILTIDLNGSLKICPHLRDLAAIAPRRPRFDGNKAPLAVFVELQVQTCRGGLAVRPVSIPANEDGQTLKKPSKNGFLLGRGIAAFCIPCQARLKLFADFFV